MRLPALILLISWMIVQGQDSGVEEQEEFPCYSLPRENYTCSHCIQFHPSCAWCTKEAFDESSKYSRCDTRKRLLSHGCLEDEIEFPQSTMTTEKDASLTDAGVTDDAANAVQLKPQEIKLKLRPKEKQTFTLSYKQAVDYPVDLYYLMDMSQSMSDDKQKLTELGDLLAQRMEKITRNFRLGFGSFVDKALMPFVDPRPDKRDKPCDNCVPPYGFKHQMSLEKNANRFKNQVNASEISGNLDAPEGGFDALIQALACKEIIKWRNGSRKMIVFSTDAGFHYAGDGRLAGVVVPNDGLCHIDQHTNMYTMSLEQDYPSIAQVHETLKREQANIIFAVTRDQVKLYNRLLEAIPDVSSTVGELADDSRNIVELIAQEYGKISQKIQMVDDAPQDIRVTYRTKCKGNRWSDLNVCEGIKVGDQVDFEVTLEALRCGEKREFNIKIGPAGLTEELRLKVEVICDCECSSPTHRTYVPNSPDCKWQGNKVCGICQCTGTNVGRKCECSARGVSTAELDAKCKRTNESQICEGRGTCDCGRCVCNPRPNAVEQISGEFCECDNFNCPRHNRKICNGHGICVCQTCECEFGWKGRSCQCPVSEESCRSPNGKICNGRGICDCGVCICDTDKEGIRYSGPTCDICPTCPTKCVEYRACVMCQQFGTGPYNKTQCDECTKTMFKVIPVDELPEKINNRSMTDCQFVDPADDCTFYFMYELDETERNNVTVWVKKKKDCPPPVPVLAIILGVIAGIVLIGLILLLVWKLLTIIHDRRELAQFNKDRLNARWDTGENPIYHAATTTFKNPAYGGRQ